MSDISIGNQKVAQDASGNLNLTDIWKLAGCPSDKATSNWRHLSTTHQYIDSVAQKLGRPYVRRVNNRKSVVYSKSGKGGGTFGHVLVAIAYGEYLNPSLAAELRQAYLRFCTGDLSLADQIL